MEQVPEADGTEKVDIYDFDKTLVPFDSGSLFIFFCAARYPWVLLYFPVWFFSGIGLALGILPLDRFKNYAFGFVRFVPLQRAVTAFWNRYEGRVYPWFRARTRRAVIISASPDFLLREICRREQVDDLLCTPHNAKTGRLLGENCRGETKVARFHAAYPGVRVADVYSDSYRNDRPIFSLATGNCYHIEKGAPVRFVYAEQYKTDKDCK